MTVNTAYLYAREHGALLAGTKEDQRWADGRHDGDCTKQAHTCVRCMVEEYEKEARKRYANDMKDRADDLTARERAWYEGDA